MRLIDPGIDILFRLATSNIEVASINTVFASHGHLDHVGGVNTISDFLIRAHQNTEVIAPESVFAQKEISDFHSGIMAHGEKWKSKHFPTAVTERKPIKLAHGNYCLEPILLHHGIECYGLKLTYKNKSIIYISDTGYSKIIKTKKGTVPVGELVQTDDFIAIEDKFEDLRAAVASSDVLIANIETLQYNKNSKTHLTVHDVIDMVQDNAVKLLVIAHVNPRAELGIGWIRGIAKYIQSTTNVTCIFPTIKGLSLQIT